LKISEIDARHPIANSLLQLGEIAMIIPAGNSDSIAGKAGQKLRVGIIGSHRHWLPHPSSIIIIIMNHHDESSITDP
jgi:hypothetical protein